MKRPAPFRKYPALGTTRFCNKEQKAKTSIAEQGALSTVFVSALGVSAGSMSNSAGIFDSNPFILTNLFYSTTSLQRTSVKTMVNTGGRLIYVQERRKHL